ncbi:glycosyltransferase family 4 protein [Pelagicoccus sp. SDUM812003]|uniref:glycosyltransferase family 4 protein n=1 Tax=Pelagicoccus sp. SDUM812003 TaxID=3041267 RepID=UPI00280F4C1B|nr:glycosyltransferase family 4 protein [Pelagicoccus sp. SDUM812003]MDQ8204741.1 glycosyltransferase family 4 protein [Pelagicoccus sp. SDUM812003]
MQMRASQSRNPYNVSNKLRRIAFVGGFEPRRCGIATFTRDACEAVSAALPSATCYAGAVNDRSERYDYPERVRFEISEKDLDSYRRAADYLNFNNADILCVQHEFGIYGGPAGSHLLALLKEVRMPVVSTLHTILQTPNPAQRRVMDELAKRSDRLVVMAQMGARILNETYGISNDKIDIIPHGIPDTPFADSESFKVQFGVQGRQVLLTFGLLGPGKGIEHAIKALPEIAKRHPNVVYLILGATHPHLVEAEGETYRLRLERLAADLDMKEHVIFYNRFVSPEDLAEFIGAADIYLTPYSNMDQITSGTLAYVYGAGKAVVSTPYWHAQELLADGRGALVPFGDPSAIAKAACDYLEDPDLHEKTRRAAYQQGRSMIWPAVAERYLDSFQHALSDRKTSPRTAFAGWTLANRQYDLPPLRLDHIDRMSDGTGIFQHATYNVPNFDEGYCADDNARAYILCNLLAEHGNETTLKTTNRLATVYLAFLSAALDTKSGRFRNFMSHTRNWLEKAGAEDSHARSLWAMGVGASRSKDLGHRRLCAECFERALPPTLQFSSPRAWAFALLGIEELLPTLSDADYALNARTTLTEKLVDIWQRCSTPDWPWFESNVTYDNARLAQALILSGYSTPEPQALEIGLKSLRWLVSIQSTPGGYFRPIGSNGFYKKDGARAEFDQQPVEALAMISATLVAYRVTQEESWSREAHRIFEWFLGRNDLGLPLYDSATGGCCDGLHPDRVNHNQGAESTLAFHLALAEMNNAQHFVTLSPHLSV